MRSRSEPIPSEDVGDLNQRMKALKTRLRRAAAERASLAATAADMVDADDDAPLEWPGDVERAVESGVGIGRIDLHDEPVRAVPMPTPIIGPTRRDTFVFAAKGLVLVVFLVVAGILVWQRLRPEPDPPPVETPAAAPWSPPPMSDVPGMYELHSLGEPPVLVRRSTDH